MGGRMAARRPRSSTSDRLPLRQGARAVLRPLARPATGFRSDAVPARAVSLGLLARRRLPRHTALQPARAGAGAELSSQPRLQASRLASSARATLTDEMAVAVAAARGEIAFVKPAAAAETGSEAWASTGRRNAGRLTPGAAAGES